MDWNQWAAEKVMGYEIDENQLPLINCAWVKEKGKKDFWSFSPLTDLNHLFMVVEKMRELGWSGSISWWGKNESSPIWCAKFYHFNPDRTTEDFFNDNLNLAVLEAAKKALEESDERRKMRL